jgi:alkylation response protein AidB-like acyl-CoA dehydrogenase
VQFDLVSTTPAEEKLRVEVRDFLAVELPDDQRVALGQAGDGYSPEFSRKLAARGWVAMALPVEYGGRGASAVERFIVAEELMAAQAPISAHWIADRQTAPSILSHGTEAQKKRFLPAIAAGECYFAIGMSEPEAGSDLAAVRTRAVRVDGGWSVSGTKVWTTWAQHAHWFAVLCRTSEEESKHQGLSQLLVDLKSPGVTVSPIKLLDGDEDFCEVHLDSVFVPDDLVLGELGSGWPQVTSELSYERYGPERSMSAWGVVRALLEIAGPEAGERVSTGVARLIARQRVIRQLSFAIARSVDAGARPATEAAVVKDLGTVFEQHAVEVVRDLLEAEIDPTRAGRMSAVLSRAVLTQPIFTIRGGTTEVLRSILAKGLR